MLKVPKPPRYSRLKPEHIRSGWAVVALAVILAQSLIAKPQAERRIDHCEKLGPVPGRVVCDPTTGFLWTRRDNGRDIAWRAAVAYCEDLTVAGIAGWELPTVDELAALYDSSESETCDEWVPFFKCHPRLGIDLTSPYIWSRTDHESASRAQTFLFNTGWRGSNERIHSDSLRALCVRYSTRRQ